MDALGDGSGTPAKKRNPQTQRLQLYRALLQVSKDPNFPRLFLETRHHVAEALGYQDVIEKTERTGRSIPNEETGDEVPEHIRFEQMDSDLWRGEP